MADDQRKGMLPLRRTAGNSPPVSLAGMGLRQNPFLFAVGPGDPLGVGNWQAAEVAGVSCWSKIAITRTTVQTRQPCVYSLVARTTSGRLRTFGRPHVSYSRAPRFSCHQSYIVRVRRDSGAISSDADESTRQLILTPNSLSDKTWLFALPNNTRFRIDMNQWQPSAYRVIYDVSGATLALRGFAIPNGEHDVGQLHNPLACC